ncbi:MAG: hypothetical protein JSV42_12300 [Chloroflexota bacterium]|nr:MAG: hypothetical protein JSV42_12300 [Chloroflexota bacterium]
MGQVELLLSIVIALLYLGVPVVVLIVVLRINQRVKHIEKALERKKDSES